MPPGSGGLDLPWGRGGDNRNASDWILHQGEIAVRGATLRWTDEAARRRRWKPTAVDLVVRNTLRKHALLLERDTAGRLGRAFQPRAASSPSP